jgi:hypothetical protein
MEVSLPSSLDFSKALPELPNGTTCTLMSLQATNGTEFGPGQVVQFDFPARKGLFIDGKSLFMRYSIEYTATATATAIKRKPVYTTWARLDEFVGSVPVNSIYQYNQVANALVDLRYNLADVYGVQFSWGLNQTASIIDVDGVVPTASAISTYTVAAPLIGSFMQEADKLIPTGLMAPIRVQLTIDSITNMVTVAAGISGIKVKNVELCFGAIDFGGAVEDMIASMAPKLYLKTAGVANASQTVGAGSNGFMTLPFNHRYESIRNAYLLSSSNDTVKAVNTWGDSFNPLGASGVVGTVQLQIGQAVYPQLPINNATGGVASILQYDRECVGLISDNRLSQCFISDSFNQFATGTTASTANIPAKCIIGFPLSRINQTSPYQQIALMSGVSAASTPINVLLNAGSPFNSVMNFYLVVEYDSLLEIDVMTHQVRVIC